MRLNIGLSYCLSAIAHGHLVTRVQLVLSLQCVKVMCVCRVLYTLSMLRFVRLCNIMVFLFFVFMFCNQNLSGQ